MQQYKVAGYVRLSKEDKIKDESNSITNQKDIINSYIKNNDEFELTDFYIDDGYSGTTFDRPEFKRMIKDITEDKVNTIIVKDLSRFGRNHIEADNYIENFLPGYNVRIISINDNIDTLKLPKSNAYIEIPLKNLMNDCYVRDISEKVKSTLKVKQQNGDFIGTFAPYGYLKDPKDKHKLIIDKDSSIIVRKIFDMILLGKSRKEIADFLNDNNILTPSLYKINKEKTNNEEFALSKKWNAEIVNRILRNETYTGTLIQNIKTKPSYKNNKLIDVNKEDWIKNIIVADLKSVDVIFLCIPSSIMREITSKLNKIVSKECIFVNTSKGLEKDTNKRMSEIIEEETKRPPVVLSGPNIASEMAKNNFSATTIAGTNKDDLETVEKLLSTDRFKVNANNDVIGTEWCGTIKNVLAISQGLCEGMEINANARLAVFTMSYNETKDLIEILGGERDTVDDYCGFGDMVTASILNVSRNHTLGILYGQRIVIDEKASGVLFEGKNTTEILKGICEELNFNSLTVNFVYDVLINGKTPLEAFDELWKHM